MVMAAKSADGETVELIDIPANAKPGDVVKVSSLPDPTPDKKIKIKSNKMIRGLKLLNF